MAFAPTASIVMSWFGALMEPLPVLESVMTSQAQYRVECSCRCCATIVCSQSLVDGQLGFVWAAC